MSRSHWRSKFKCYKMVSTLYLLRALKDFYESKVKCSPHQVDMQNPISRSNFPRSRWQSLVKSQMLQNYRIFMKFASDVHLNKVTCTIPFQDIIFYGQGHTWRSKVKIVFALYLPFVQLFWNLVWMLVSVNTRPCLNWVRWGQKLCLYVKSRITKKPCWHNIGHILLFIYSETWSEC